MIKRKPFFLVLIFAASVQSVVFNDVFNLFNHGQNSVTNELYSASQLRNSFDACVNQFPNNRPLVLNNFARLKPLALCSDNFAVLYSQVTKTPIVSVERLNSTQINEAKGRTRTNVFFADPRVPESGSAQLSDYQGSHFDRGHQTPAGDEPAHNAMIQSFALSNIVPQSNESNRKSWADIEKSTRKFVLRATGDVYVFTGPIFDRGHGTIGRNVWVPTRLFKLVYDETSHRSWAYIMPNAESNVLPPVSYDDFVKETGLHLL